MTKKNSIQIYPADNLTITVDALSKKAFETTLRGGQTIEDTIIESRRKKIISNITLINGAGKDIRLNEFDRAVLDVCLAEQEKGNEVTTPRTIFHQLGGGYVLYDNMKKAILDSIEKLACVRIFVDIEEAVDKKIYITENGETHYRGYLLPTESKETVINGQKVSSIKFLSKGIIYKIANLKNQITTCPKNLLKSPIRATPRTIAINHYLLRRILEIKGSHESVRKNKRVTPLRNIITLQDMYEKCDIPLDNRRAKQQAKETATAILNFFVEKNIIASFNFEKKDGQFYSISLTFQNLLGTSVDK